MTRGKKTVSLYNHGTTPVVYDTEGRIVAGGERIELAEVNAVAQEAIDNGLLVHEDEKAEDEAADVPRDGSPGASAPKKTS